MVDRDLIVERSELDPSWTVWSAAEPSPPHRQMRAFRSARTSVTSTLCCASGCRSLSRIWLLVATFRRRWSCGSPQRCPSDQQTPLLGGQDLGTYGVGNLPVLADGCDIARVLSDRGQPLFTATWPSTLR